MYVYKYRVDIYLLCMIKIRVRWCTFSLCENVITLGKLIGLMILFCHPLLSIFFENSKNKRNDLTLPVMVTIFLVVLLWCQYLLYLGYIGNNKGADDVVIMFMEF